MPCCLTVNNCSLLFNHVVSDLRPGKIYRDCDHIYEKLFGYNVFRYKVIIQSLTVSKNDLGWSTNDVNHSKLLDIIYGRPLMPMMTIQYPLLIILHYNLGDNSMLQTCEKTISHLKFLRKYFLENLTKLKIISFFRICHRIDQGVGCRNFEGITYDGGKEKGMYCFCLGDNCNTGLI